jgi:hypothetical protein
MAPEKDVKPLIHNRLTLMMRGVMVDVVRAVWRERYSPLPLASVSTD